MATSTEQSAITLDPAILALLPEQGTWTVRDYLWLTDGTNRLVEFTDGTIEVLPMPTEKHQAISSLLYLALLAMMQRIGGKVFYAPLRLRVGPRMFREPDLLLVLAADDPRRGNSYWEGADLVVEIVSPDDPSRDYVRKREDYARAGVLEYWIVDPQAEKMTVLQLAGTAYTEYGVFGRGTLARSVLLPELEIDVDAVLDAS
jgi:Uma2 family endonuclease